MGAFVDLTNKKFGKWTVIARDYTDRNGHIHWKCKCDCGKESSVSGDQLKSGRSKSCGCSREKDFTGQRFGKLVAIKRIKANEIGKTATYYECLCDCGNTVIVRGKCLTSGGTVSCGCYHHEKDFVDLTGRKFGKLTVLYILNKYENTPNKWHCKCECGNECDVLGSNLIGGSTHSCGCLTISHGVFKISQLLKDNNIPFQREQSFNTLLSDKNSKLRYDFAILDNNNKIKYLIEFDGKQHFKAVDYFGGEEELKIRQSHDERKNQWALKNNIPLIRIPYTYEKNLCLEDLLLETSKFIIKGG